MPADPSDGETRCAWNAVRPRVPCEVTEKVNVLVPGGAGFIGSHFPLVDGPSRVPQWMAVGLPARFGP